MAIREARVGAEHLDTAKSLHILALVLHSQGDLAGARPLHERALAISEARLGADHPDTARILGSLGVVLAGLGRLPAARARLVRAVSILERRLGRNHPTTIYWRRNLSALGGGSPGRGRRR